MSSPRYVVGIDLGTTHSALAYADTRVEAPTIQLLELPQLVTSASTESKALLPSFLYFAHPSEGAMALPWAKERTFAVGEFARTRGLDAPNRVVQSAKSWLCHPTVDRRAGILPLGAPEDIERISPVEASFRYLEHVSECFDAFMAEHDPGQKLADQDVVLTVPASFDAAARDLTVEAAKAAGIEKLTLLEEPQAALYAWTLARGDAWRKDLKVGDVLVVVDVGGGTTDFSAIAVREEGGSLSLERVAVGDHILLGGDNMDLFLSHVVKARLEADGKTVDAFQMAQLGFACRAAKEKLLSGETSKAVPIAVASKGSKLVGGTLRTELTQKDVEDVILEGFFPASKSQDLPQARTRAGLTQLGLPYAQDAAITKHLAAFLRKQGGEAAGLLKPTCVLYNGGVMKSAALRGRVQSALESWMKAEKAPAPRALDGADYDLAVARGAAYYGLAKRGRGLRIRGGMPRAYYVGIESSMPAIPGMAPPVDLLCVAPFGMEEGTSADMPAMELGMVVGEPVDFRFFGSSVRKKDAAGAAIGAFPVADVEELAPIRANIKAKGRNEGDVVPVRLRAVATEIGTLELRATPVKPLEDGEQWLVELNVRQG